MLSTVILIVSSTGDARETSGSNSKKKPSPRSTVYRKQHDEARPAGRVADAGIAQRLGTGDGMTVPDDSKTSPTLLGRLAVAPPDQAAWSEFVDRYGPRILLWCRAWGLQEADTLDTSQAVLAKLSVQLRTFRYDRSRSFRGWLRSVVRTAVRDALAARRLTGTGTTDMLERMASVEARDDLVRRLDEEFDLELLEVATAIVRARVTAKSWGAYQLTAVEGRAASQVAEMLGMRVGAVYQAKSSVIQMLQDEVRKLGGDSAESNSAGD